MSENRPKVGNTGAMRNANSNVGRPALEFTSRVCKGCKELCPYEMYVRKDTRKPRGYSIQPLCKICIRKYQREWRAERYQDPEYRREQNLRRRSYQVTSDQDYVSLHQWTKYRMKQWRDVGAYPAVVFLIPCKVHTPHAKPSANRPWIGKTWAIRADRPGINPPPNSIPFLRVSRQLVAKHPTCPDGWDVAVRVAQLRLRLLFPPEGGE